MRAKKDAFAFLRFVYEKIPPTYLSEASRKLPELNSSNISKICLKACTHYHPDRYVDICFTGHSLEDTKFLATEIFKRVNHFYSRLKEQ